jgi:hypothetical protein
MIAFDMSRSLEGVDILVIGRDERKNWDIGVMYGQLSLNTASVPLAK